MTIQKIKKIEPKLNQQISTSRATGFFNFSLLTGTVLLGLVGFFPITSFACDDCHDTSLGVESLLVHRPYCGGEGPGELPSPFEGVNDKVELADGEYYYLLGTVHWASSSEAAIFEVDSNAHPWITQKHKKANPRYALAGNPQVWKPFANHKVRLLILAHGRILSDFSKGSLIRQNYSICLHSLKAPKVVSIPFE